MRSIFKLIRAALLVAAVVGLPAREGWAQPSPAPKRVLLLYWYNRDYPGNISFDQSIRAALRSAPGPLEYYSEYLESNRFPGENQSVLLRDYLRNKYATVPIDVIITNTPAPLEFLLKYRSNLFPNTPIVFATIDFPAAEAMSAGPGATGIVYARNHRKTLDLALQLHPDTQQVFIVTGTAAFETTSRKELEGYESEITIHYLTNLPYQELMRRISHLPERSIVLYVRQQFFNETGRATLEPPDVLSSIARSANAPIYGMADAYLGLGIVGGHVWTTDGNAAKLVEIAVHIMNGRRPVNIPVERAPTVPMFDWRQLQRWAVREGRLPPNSVIRFHEPTMWQQYKWRIVGAVIVIALQAFLIFALLVERHRARRAQQKLREHEEQLEQVVQQRTAELVEARDQALAANRSKSMFLANMSHELRTPLNAILGFSALVRAGTNLSERQRHDLAIVGSSGEHLLGLIDDVLDTAKIETARTALESAPVDLHSLLNETLAMLQERAQAKNLELLLEISAEVPRFVRSDPGKLRQVLINLIGNAVKYTDEGSVVVRLSALPGTDSEHFVLILEVEDTGIGISEDDRTRIFDPFVQAGSARISKGAGLGLSISQHFVQLLGGTIQVESKVGQGSCFRVEIPAQIAEASVAIAEATAVKQVVGLEPGQPQYRVLIAEDKRENWLLLERLLQTVGFEVRVAEDGARAIESFESWRPDFIWMDVRLPVMSGLEATRRIRELEGGRDVKIVAVTASAFTSPSEHVMAAGFDDFLRKPYRHAAIFDCMAQQLGVKFMYGTPTSPTVTPSHRKLYAEDLATLPTELRDELERAVLSLDPEWIGHIVAQISEQNASLGVVLRPFSDTLTFSPILQALQDCKRRLAEAEA